jgi:hypothetical protein
MKKINKLMSLFLVLAIFLPSMPTFSVPLPGAEEITTEDLPQNPPGTPAGVQCTMPGSRPVPPLGVCCVGFKTNGEGICDEMEFSDPALISCTSGVSCAAGTGCYQQSASDLFSQASPSSEHPDDLSEKNKSVQAQISEVENPKSTGGACVHARDCASYSCQSGSCADVSVCRYAKEGEIAGAGVNCAGDLVLGPGRKCEKSPDAKNAVYLGLIKEATVTDTGECRFELDENTRKQAIIAMSSLRAMEFMFATIKMGQDQDCFSVTPVFKDAIGRPFYETRKNILTNFTDVLNGIEFDFKQLIEAKEKSDKKITIHSDEQITEGKLASRQTSGYDSLVMMYRRNLLFQSYERSMLGTIQAANVTLSKLAKGMNTWQSGSTSWDLMGQKTSYKCEGSKYKVRPFLSWKTKYYENVADRWANYWEVTGSAPGNANIVRRDKVAKHLALFSGSTQEEAVTEFTKNFFMIDPLMFSEMNQGSFGTAKALKKGGGFLGLPIFGGFKDLRHAYYINGTGTGSFTTMYDSLKPRLRDFYKGLKTNKTQKNFIYEPELVTTSAKSCLDEGVATEKCTDFEKFLEETLDETFAQFLAWGHSNRDSYAGLFESAASYRRRLLAKIEVDMINISKYYETVIAQRDVQNSCIEKIVGGLFDSKILITDNNGILEGNYSLKGGTSSGSGAGGSLSNIPRGHPNAKFSAPEFSPLDRTKFSFDLTGSSLKKFNNESNLDGIGNNDGSSSSSKGNIALSERAFLSARQEFMNKANAKALGAGVNLAKKENAVKDIINSMNQKNLVSSGIGTLSDLGHKKSSTGINNMNATRASLGNDLKRKASDEETSGISINNDKLNMGGATDNFESQSTSPFNGADLESAAGLNKTIDSNTTGPTGFSDGEKDPLVSEYEKNKNEYQGSDDDGLFGKVSKAYVRNLDKIMTRKKKLPKN